MCNSMHTLLSIFLFTQHADETKLPCQQKRENQQHGHQRPSKTMIEQEYRASGNSASIVTEVEVSQYDRKSG